MTIDERLEFLLKSTESLHTSMHEMHSSMSEVRASVQEERASLQELRASVQELRVIAEEHTKQFAVQAESIRQLALIAGAHGDRISLLERKTGS